MSNDAEWRRGAVGADREAELTPHDGQEQEIKMLSMSELFRHLPNELVTGHNVQTHVIDGYVIQESLEPFAVAYVAEAPGTEQTSLPMDLDATCSAASAPRSRALPHQDRARAATSAATTESTQILAQAHTSASTTAPDTTAVLALTAAMSSDPDFAAAMSSPDFAATTRLVLAPLPAPIQIPAPIMVASVNPIPGPNVAQQTQMFGQQRPSILAPKKPRMWTVHDVAGYIRTLPAYAGYAEEFRRQLIDGEALFLLNELDLVNVMGMKLGLALKMCEMIRVMGEKQ